MYSPFFYSYQLNGLPQALQNLSPGSPGFPHAWQRSAATGEDTGAVLLSGALYTGAVSMGAAGLLSGSEGAVVVGTGMGSLEPQFLQNIPGSAFSVPQVGHTTGAWY